MKLSTIVNVLNEKEEIVEKELSIEVNSEVAYLKLDGKNLFELDYENLADFMEAIFKIWSQTNVKDSTRKEQ